MPGIEVLAGRWLIAGLFAAGAVQKALAPEAVQGMLADRSLPVDLVWPAAAFNLLGALSLMSGVALRPMARALALYCIATSFFHLIPQDPWQMSIFVKNWAIAGGLLVLGGSIGSGR